MEKYRLPKTHVNWQKYYQPIAALAASDKESEIIEVYKIAIEYDFPLYAMPLETMRDLIDPDLDNLARLIGDDWQPPLKGFQLALPEHELYRLFGYRVSVVWIGLSQTNHTIYAAYYCDTRRTHYKFNMDYKDPKHIKNYNWDSEADYGMGYTIAGLAIQALMLMGLKDAPVYHDPNCTKRYQPSKNAPKTRDPRWIITINPHLCGADASLHQL